MPSNRWSHLQKNAVSLSRRHETSIQIKCILHVVGANTAHLDAWCIILMLLENVRRDMCLKHRTQTVESTVSDVKINQLDEYQS